MCVELYGSYSDPVPAANPLPPKDPEDQPKAELLTKFLGWQGWQIPGWPQVDPLVTALDRAKNELAAAEERIRQRDEGLAEAEATIKRLLGEIARLEEFELQA
jgi:hypothetical protein